MKLLCINYEYPPIGGGGGVVCQGLAEALVRYGYEIDVVTCGMKDLLCYEEKNGVRIHRVRCIRRHRHYVTMPEMCTMILPLYWKALELIRKSHYDLNHTHFVIPSGIVSYLLWKKTGLPYMITAHGSDIPGYNPDRFNFAHRMINGLWKKIINNSEVITSPSKFLKELIQSFINIPVATIPNGYEFPQCGLDDRKDRILLVTRMFERKGVQFFIEALGGLDTQWEIIIAGDGPYLPKLKSLAQNNGRIQFLGFVQGERLKTLYESSKIFVFPSIQENFPIVLLEAMSAGCAIITTSAKGCAEVVGDAAIKVEPGNVHELRQAVNKLICDEQEICRLSQIGQRRADVFRWENVADQFNIISLGCLSDLNRQYTEHFLKN